MVQPWRWPGGTLTDREVILVRVVGPDSEGWGECSAFPVPAYSPEWLDGAWDILRHHLVPRVLGQPLDAAALHAPFAAIQGHHMAKSAIELAVLDAELRAAGRSLAQRLGATRSRVTAGVAVGLTGSLPALLDEVGGRVAEGYRRVKLKIQPGWDVEPVLAVRARFPDLALQVDANGSYRLADAGRLAVLDQAGLLCLEQPLGSDDLVGHAAWAGKMRTPLCLDESITSCADAESALALGACKVINIKPGRVGGYLEAVRIHDLTALRGVAVWCGGLLETGVGRTANLALAALPNFSLPGDLSASDRFYREDVTAPVVLGPDGMITVPDGPGTGAVLRFDVLDGATTQRWRAGAG
ncbi:MAG: o-succinylbenzoate synthase [Actinomycetota bacterium]|nr:o-succinylbenzoate synthase [Actinomycetota bacterium]